MKHGDLEVEAEILAENRSEEFIAGSMRTLESLDELCRGSEEGCLRTEDLQMFIDYMYSFVEYY